MGQAKPTNASEKAEQNFIELLGKFDNAMLVTHSDRGETLHARPMAIADRNADGSIWFITSSDTPKITELKQDSQIVAVLQQSKQWLSVSGTGELVRDRARINELWKETYKVWFEGGKDDPKIVLIRLNPSEAEYWDNSGWKGVRFALKATAAFVTGQELRDPGGIDQHAKVRL